MKDAGCESRGAADYRSAYQTSQSPLRQGSAAVWLTQRGRQPPRLPQRTRQTILRLARTRYAGFNDHHLCEKLSEQEGFSLSRETLRRLLRTAGIGSPANAVPRLIAKDVCDPLAKGNSCSWTALPMIGSKVAAPCSLLWACRMMLPAKSSPLSLSSETPQAIPPAAEPLASLRRSPRFYGDRSGVLCAMMNIGPSTNNSPASASPLNRPCSPTARRHHRRAEPRGQRTHRAPLGRLQDRLTSELRLAGSRSRLRHRVLRRFVTDTIAVRSLSPRRRQSRRPAPENLERICASPTIGSSATTTSSNGTATAADPSAAATIQFCGSQSAAPSRTRRGSLSTMATPVCNTHRG